MLQLAHPLLCLGMGAASRREGKARHLTCCPASLSMAAVQAANPPLDLRKEGGENYIMLVDRGPTSNPCKFAEKVGVGRVLVLASIAPRHLRTCAAALLPCRAFLAPMQL